MLAERAAEFLDGALHTFACRILAQADRAGDFGEGAVLKIAQQDRLAIVVLELVHHAVEHGLEFCPIDRGFGRGGNFLHGVGLLFADAPALL